MKKLTYSFLYTILTLLVLFQTAAYTQPVTDKKVVSVKALLNKDKIPQNEDVRVAFVLKIDKGWHVNSDKPNDDFLVPTKISVENSDGIKLINLMFPQPKEIKLSFSDKPLSAYEGEAIIKGMFKLPKGIKAGKYKVGYTVEYQSCNNATCLAPTELKDTITLNVTEIGTASKRINIGIFGKFDKEETALSDGSSNGAVTSALEKGGLFLGLIIVFLGGLALNLTPCVYPLIPITIGYFGGQSEGSTKRLVLMSIFYVLGMSVMYSAIGVITALSGSVFGSLLQNPLVLVIIGVVLFGLSLSMFGVYEFKLPDSLVAKAGGAKTGVFGSFFMGLTMGIVAAPCIGPFVLGLVTYVAAKGDPYLGFIMFFVLSLGLGLPYFLLGIFSGKIKKLPRAGEWMEGVKHIFGFLLIGMAVYFITPIFPKGIGKYLLPVFMILSGLYLIFVDKMGSKVKGYNAFKIIFSVILIAVSVYMLVPSQKKSIGWDVYSSQNLASASSNARPVIIDFYADWCIPCKELDASTFSNDEVIAESKRFSAFKADLTKSAAPDIEAIKKQFKIKGVPTVLILDSKGEEIKRITGFVPAEEFLNTIRDVK